MKFLLDAHLPPALGRLLREAGHDALHASELPDKNRTTDTLINTFSIQQDRIVISKDTDFYYSHLLNQRPHKLLLVRTGNIGVRDLIELFRRHLPAITPALEVRSLVELDRSEIRILQ